MIVRIWRGDAGLVPSTFTVSQLNTDLVGEGSVEQSRAGDGIAAPTEIIIWVVSNIYLYQKPVDCQNVGENYFQMGQFSII